MKFIGREEETIQVAQANLKPIKYGFFAKKGYNLKKNYSYCTLEDLYK